ncbi:MAG: glycosyltransferase family 4 protein, partial [Chloroflexota bacterium]
MPRPLRVLYVFTARKQDLVTRAARGEAPDTLLFGLNHLPDLGIDASFYEPEYPPLGRALARQAGRLGPDFLQLRTLRRFPTYDVVFLTGGWPLLLAAQAIPRGRRPKLIWLNMTLTNLLRRPGPFTGLLRLAVKRADRIVCVAGHQQRFLERQLGLPRQALPLVLSGTDATFYHPASVIPCPSAHPSTLG